MLLKHLEELDVQRAAIRAVLATADPETAERYLQDGVRMQISEVVLRPQPSLEDVMPLLSRAYTADATLASAPKPSSSLDI
jgi:hypothetical protein